MSKISDIFKDTALVKYARHNKSELSDIKRRLDTIEKKSNEIIFANLFRDSIQDSLWVKNKSFSAYGAAANYSLLYKLYKIYDVIKPENVLEFGLGQTTKLTYQYVAANPSTSAYVIDDDKEWIETYEKQVKIPENMQIVELGLQDFKYGGKLLQKNAEYKGLKEVIKKTKLNLVVIDGPIGGDKIYSRPNMISLVGSLAPEWIVIFDDSEREGERRTIDLFRGQLKKEKVPYSEFEVFGYKHQYFFCTPHLYKIAKNI